MLSFDYKIENIKTLRGSGFVLRDDLLEGGTKQRAVIPFLKSLMDEGYSEFVYASPFSGFAQVALASALKHLDVKVTVFCEANEDGDFHQFSKLASKMGAKTFLCSSLVLAEDLATSYCSADQARYKIPLGFDDLRFRSALEVAIRNIWYELKDQVHPNEVWLPVGSGTLAKVFRQIVDPKIKLHCVDVHVLTENDSRIQSVRKLENVSYWSVGIPFHVQCKNPCPVPSNAYYDSKVFELFKGNSQERDLWWNVAR